jgi:uncharacterized protein YbjT (DUF2867 family)
LVLLTGRGEEGSLRSEWAVIAAGVPTVVVRAAFFAQGFTEDGLAAAVGAGVLRLRSARRRSRSSISTTLPTSQSRA